MHEGVLLMGILKQVEQVVRAAGAARAVALTVRLGALSHVSAEHLHEHFARESRGTVAEGARLRIESADDVGSPLAQEIVLESVEVAEG